MISELLGLATGAIKRLRLSVRTDAEYVLPPSCDVVRKFLRVENDLLVLAPRFKCRMTSAELVDMEHVNSADGLARELRNYRAMLNLTRNARLGPDADKCLDPFQFEMIDAIIGTVMRWIFRSSFEQSKNRIFQLLNRKPPEKIAFLIAGRRGGKSASLGVALAALLLHVYGTFIIRVYAQQKDAATAILDDVLAHAKVLQQRYHTPNVIYKEHVQTASKPVIKFRSPLEPDVVKEIRAFPAGINNLRGGKNPQLIVIDEVMAIRADALRTAILPNALVEGTGIVLASSPASDTTSVMHAIIQAKDPVTQQPYCALATSQKPCALCTASGYRMCGHLKTVLSHWINQSSFTFLAQVMPTDMYRREVLGELPPGPTPLLNDATVLSLCANEGVAITETVYAIFVFIDPSYGGSSCTGISSMCITLTGYCVVRKQQTVQVY